MPFVRRDPAGQIVALSLEPEDGYQAIEEDDPELIAFHAKLHGELGPLGRSDFDVIRVLDDLINLLISQNTIRFTDLPPEAQQKLMHRRSLRGSANALDLVGDDDEQPLI